MTNREHFHTVLLGLYKEKNTNTMATAEHIIDIHMSVLSKGIPSAVDPITQLTAITCGIPPTIEAIRAYILE